MRKFILSLFLSAFAATAFAEPTAANSYVIAHPEQRYEVHSDIVINAPADVVWNVLTDGKNTGKWNSALVEIVGEMKDQGQITARYKTVTGSVQDFSHQIKMENGKEFSWSDPIAHFDGLTDDHHFIVAKIDDSHSRFIQRDTYQGTAYITNDKGEKVPFTAEMLANAQVPAFATFNQELKTEAEKRYQAQQ